MLLFFEHNDFRGIYILLLEWKIWFCVNINIKLETKPKKISVNLSACETVVWKIFMEYDASHVAESSFLVQLSVIN